MQKSYSLSSLEVRISFSSLRSRLQLDRKPQQQRFLIQNVRNRPGKSLLKTNLIGYDQFLFPLRDSRVNEQASEREIASSLH